MFDLQATIMPGKSAAGLSIGEPLPRPLPRKCLTAIRLGGSKLLEWDDVRVWTRDGLISQIGVRGRYVGRIQGTTIGIGSTLKDVTQEVGAVVEDDEDNLVVPDLPGFCFDTEAWRPVLAEPTVEENLDAKITEIIVYKV